MKVLVFGASGLSGRELVIQALQHGHIVSAFVRDPAKLGIQHSNLICKTGNVANADSVREAVKGHDAVLCALGASTLFKRDPTLVQGIKNIVAAMEQEKVNRLIYLSFLGVRENRQELGFLINNIVARLLSSVILDHEEKEQCIKNSALEWTIVRPPKLTNGPHTRSYRSGEHIVSKSLILNISRADVADFMIQQLSSNVYLHKAPRVMY